MDVAQYEDFLAFLRSKSLSQSEWVYPSFVRTPEERRAYRDKAEHMVLGTKNLGTSVGRESRNFDVQGGSEGRQRNASSGEGNSNSAYGVSGIGFASCRVQCFCKAHNSC